MVLRTLGLTLAVAFTLPLLTSAQMFESSDPFTLSVSPQFPLPYGEATLTPTSGSIDITNATLTVTTDGAQTYQGNARPVKVRLGAPGVAVAVIATIKANNKSYEKKLSIRPQDVSIVAEPRSTAPPLYAGKPLVPLDGSVRVVAVANIRSGAGKVVAPSALVYTWSLDGKKVIGASGIGKDTFLVASPPRHRESRVAVSVQTQDESAAGGAFLTLSPQNPIVRIYKSDPLLGVLFDHALSGSYAISGAESSLFGAPYSFPSSRGTPVLKWFLNGATAQTGNTITLRPTGSGKGGASLSLTASAGESISATLSLPITFGAASGGNSFFGL